MKSDVASFLFSATTADPTFNLVFARNGREYLHFYPLISTYTDRSSSYLQVLQATISAVVGREFFSPSFPFPSVSLTLFSLSTSPHLRSHLLLHHRLLPQGHLLHRPGSPLPFLHVLLDDPTRQTRLFPRGTTPQRRRTRTRKRSKRQEGHRRKRFHHRQLHQSQPFEQLDLRSPNSLSSPYHLTPT